MSLNASVVPDTDLHPVLVETGTVVAWAQCPRIRAALKHSRKNARDTPGNRKSQNSVQSVLNFWEPIEGYDVEDGCSFRASQRKNKQDVGGEVTLHVVSYVPAS